MTNDRVLWEGRPLSDLTRDELEDALTQAVHDLRQLRAQSGEDERAKAERIRATRERLRNG